MRPRARLGYVGALAAAMLVIVGATGNLSYAASSISHAASSVSHATRDLFSSGKQIAQPNIGAACNQYALAPTISRLSVTSGITGAAVTITGTNFSGNSLVSSVKFFSGVVAAFTVNSSTTITTHVPSGAITGPITVTNCKSHANSVAFKVIPTVTSFAPTAAKVGTAVTINGTAFVNHATTVKFNGIASTSVTYLSSRQIRAIVPPTDAGAGKITVTTAGGTGTSSALFKIVPTITNFTPTSGKRGVATITINGSGFVRNGTTVKLGNFTVTPASRVTFLSYHQIRVSVPPNVPPGRVKITVTTVGGTVLSTAFFTVTR